MKININAVQKQIRALADRSHLRIVEEDVDQPRTDGKNVYIPRFNPYWSEQRIIRWWWSVIHEMGHNAPETRDCFDIIKTHNIDMSSWLGQVINHIDDYRNEYNQMGVYDFVDNCLDKGRSEFVREKKEEWLEGFSKVTDDGIRKIITLMVWDMEIRESWMPRMSGLYQEFEDVLDSEQQEWLTRLRAGDYESVLKIKPVIDSETEYQLVRRIIEEVFGEDADEVEQQSQAQSGGQGEGEGEGEEGQSGDGNSTEKGEGEQGQAQSDKGEKRSGEATVRYEDLLPHNHGGDGYSEQPLTITYPDGRENHPYESKGYEVRACTHRQGRYYQCILDGSGSTTLSRRVSRLLQILSRSKRVSGQKRGKLHSKSLSRTATTHIDPPVFWKKENGISLDVAVTVLCDGSGSMGGGKSVHAGISMMLLDDVLSKLQIPVELLGFSTSYSFPIHYVVKSFGEKLTKDKLAGRIDDMFYDSSANADGEAIVWAYNRLIQKPAKRHILIVLSDGQPAWADGIVDYTEDVVKHIEKEKRVDIYGVGIMSNSVKRFYKDYVVIKDASELEDALFEIIKQKII